MQEHDTRNLIDRHHARLNVPLFSFGEINIQIKPFPHKNDIIMIALLTWLILINNIYYYYEVVWSDG